jgi:iron-sulfur cluster assembly accessory protein
MPSVIEVTAAAQAHVSAILSANPGKHLRVSINSQGCSGHKYQYDLCDWDSLGRWDEVIDWPGGRVVLDAKSLLGLMGSTLDLSVDIWATQLIWHNPQAQHACGCGESFALADSAHAAH